MKILKGLYFILIIFISLPTFCQVDSIANKKVQSNKDSIEDKDKASSYFELSLNLSNQMFSNKNFIRNINQPQNQLVLSPILSYTHKSGFGLSASAFFTNVVDKFKSYQYSISPFFKIDNKNIEANIIYTRMIASTKNNASDNPYQNDYYADIKLKRSQLIQPSIVVDYSTGIIDDTTTIGNKIVSYTLNLKSFSISSNFSHTFKINNLFIKEDNISIMPTIGIELGSDKVDASINLKRNKFPKKIANLKNALNSNTGFGFQNLIFSSDFRYEIKNFFIDPNITSTYYLQNSNDKRLNFYFSLNIGFNF